MGPVADFVTKAADLYNAAPGFVTSVLGGLGTFGLFSVWFSWWLRGYFVDGASANTKGQIENLKEQISLQEQRLHLANDQNQNMAREIDKLKIGVHDKVVSSLQLYFPAPEAASTTAFLDNTIASLRSANTALSSTLTSESIGNLGRYRVVFEAKPEGDDS